MAKDTPLWPPDLGWMIDAALESLDMTSSSSWMGQLEMGESSWLRLQALARSGSSFTYRGAIVAFASPPTASRHSDILPPYFQVSLGLTVKPST